MAKATNRDTASSKILIVDDHPAVREALIVRISQTPNLTVCGEAADAAEALRLLAETDPDVAIIDIALKNSNGIDLIKRIKARNSRVAMIVWSMHSERLYAERALRAGAMGYITKEQATDKIMTAISQVRAGKIYVSDELSTELVEHLLNRRNKDAKHSSIESLSDRELQTFELLGQGLTTDEIAEKMHLSLKTVGTYRTRIKDKLAVRTSAELIQRAVLWAVRNG